MDMSITTNGVFITNIFSKRFAEIFASNSVPVEIISARPVLCSRTINAPVLVSAKLVALEMKTLPGQEFLDKLEELAQEVSETMDII